MNTAHCRIYLELLREARETAQKDSENFSALIHAFERIGAMEKGKLGKGLGTYESELLAIAGNSPLCKDQSPHYHSSAANLFTLIKRQRNAAMHQGFVARNLVRHSVEFALILEHAIKNMKNVITVADLMIRDVCYADIDHPMSYIRQRMLVNAFSFMPVIMTDGAVKMLSDIALAKWLRQMSWDQQQLALVRTLRDEITGSPPPLDLCDPVLLPSQTPIGQVVAKFVNSMPILLHEPNDKTKIVGLISAFDLL